MAVERHTKTEGLIKTKDHIMDAQQKGRVDRKIRFCQFLVSVHGFASLPSPHKYHTLYLDQSMCRNTDQRLEERSNQFIALLLGFRLYLPWVPHSDSSHSSWTPMYPSNVQIESSCGTPVHRNGLSPPKISSPDAHSSEMESFRLVARVPLPALQLSHVSPTHHMPFFASHITSSV